MGAKAGQSYKLKPTTGKFNVNASMYTEEHIAYLKEKFAPYLYLFGYTNHPEKENSTAFVNFEDHKPEHLEKYYGFRKINEEAIAKLVKDGGYKGPGYKVNADECFDFVPNAEIYQVHVPAREWSERKLGIKK